MKLWLLLWGVVMLTSCHTNNRSQKEQNLHINLKAEPVSLDPRKGNDMVASQLHFMLFEGLLKLTPDMTTSLAQAKSYDISADGKTYTFHLGNTKWSNNSPVTARDFEMSWKSLLDPSFPCPDAYLLYAVKNAKLAKKGEISLDEVGIRSIGEKTLVIELEHPSLNFLQIVASSVLLPVSWENSKKNPHWATSVEQFVSNGPFKLKKWKFNQEMVLEKNENYHLAKDVKLNHISIDIIDREMAVLHMFTTGYFDLIGTPLSFFPAMLQQDLEKKDLLTFFPVATTKFLAFNTSSFPFNDKNIRRAFALAIDRKTIVNHITQLKEKEALNVIPPALLPKQELSLFKDGDITEAKACLQKGLAELNLQAKDLKNVSLMYCGNEINHLLAQELQNRWLAVLGIQVNLEQVEFKVLHERSKNSAFSIGLFAWVADYADPMNILERFEDKTNHRNYAKWENERYNGLLKEALAASSKQHYYEKVREAENLLVDEMPITCLYHDNYSFLIRPYIRDFYISPLGHIYFEKISVDTAMKREPILLE